MKHITYAWLAGVILTLGLAAPAPSQDQPLGDYARKVRQEKTKEPPAAKKFDNDNLPTTDKLSIVGNAPATPEAGAADADKPADNAATPKPEDKAPQSAEQRQKAYDQWKDKIADQKAQIDSLAKE